MKKLFSTIYLIAAVATAMIGHTIHGNIFFSIMDFLFMPIAWIWWLIGHDVNMTVIKQTFEFFLQ